MKNKIKGGLKQARVAIRFADLLSITDFTDDMSSNKYYRFRNSFSLGLCWLWWYTSYTQSSRFQFLSKEFKKKGMPKIDYDWFYETEEIIYNWDNKKKLSKSKIIELSKFIGLTLYFSHIDKFLPWSSKSLDGSMDAATKNDILELENDNFTYDQTVLEKNLEAIRNRKLTKEYSFGSLVTLKQIKQLLKTKNIIQEGRIVLLESFNEGLSSGFYKDGNKYIYFDPTSIRYVGECEITTASIDEIAELIYETHFDQLYYSETNLCSCDNKEKFLNYNKSFPLSLKIFSFDDKKAEYPNKKTILEKINPDIIRDKYSSLSIAVKTGDLEIVSYF